MQTRTVGDTPLLVAQLRSFCFPAGEETAHGIHAIRTTQRGEMRMSPQSRWIPFTAEQFIDATVSNFRWEARIDPRKVTSPTVIDAFEQGRGYLAVKLGGFLAVRKVTGPEADRGELQRYLASVLLCPAILLRHPTLDLELAGPSTLRLQDRLGPNDATVELELSEDGCPVVVRAMRPRIVGRQSVLTPWTAHASDFGEYEGLRVPVGTEVSWLLPEGEFQYFREETVSFAVVR